MTWHHWTHQWHLFITDLLQTTELLDNAQGTIQATQSRDRDALLLPAIHLINSGTASYHLILSPVDTIYVWLLLSHWSIIQHHSSTRHMRVKSLSILMPPWTEGSNLKWLQYRQWIPWLKLPSTLRCVPITPIDYIHHVVTQHSDLVWRFFLRIERVVITAALPTRPTKWTAKLRYINILQGRANGWVSGGSK